MKKRTGSILFVLLFHLSIKAQVNSGDSMALVDLYHSTNGVYWKNNSNWLNGRVSEWAGVKVTNNRVTGLYLVNNQLDGTLPASLGNLTAITDLYLDNNLIKGTIPSSIGDLSALIFLYLSNNKLEGNIPAAIGNATALRELHLQHNKLSGEIPASIKNLESLREVILAYNQLTGSIPERPGGRLVQRLELNDNQFSGSIPAALQNIRDLKIVKLNNNQLTGEIPSGLLSKMCYLVDLSSNHLTGSIPSDLGNNSTLVHVNLSNNELTGQIPSTIGNMTGLQSLELDNNQLSGNIPSSFSSLNRLYRLNLKNNQLSGSIPEGLCDLPNLEFLGLSNNQFTFDGMECIGSKQHSSMFVDYTYENQKKLNLRFADAKISLSAGGSLPNNTYYLYKEDELLTTVKGDSTFTVSEGGKYRVEVTNDKADQLTLYSDIIDVSSSIILPLDWLGFTAMNCSDNVCLRWETANEQNTSHFEVERSIDGSNFTKIGTQASHNTPGEHSYSATDYAPANGLNFYRIKQVDRDGVYSYSSIASIRINSKELLTITPNPANNFIVLNGISKAKTVSIYNMEGKLLNQWSNVNGNQQLNIANLRPGIFIIKVLLNNKEDTYKLVKY